jgi:hypothetical protein
MRMRNINIMGLLAAQAALGVITPVPYDIGPGSPTISPYVRRRSGEQILNIGRLHKAFRP